MDIARVKRLRRSITLHFIVIAWLTAMLVATGTQSYFLPILIFCVGISAYVFVDTLEWFEVGRLGSYALMSIATVIAMGNYVYYTLYSPSESGQLMAVASLLVFPEAVLFMQRKNLRIFEQLAVFLLLEMIVAALVNDNIVFGLLLAPIMLLWVSSLFLFARYATLVYVDSSIESPIPHLAELIYQKIRKNGKAKPKQRVQSQVVTAKNVQGSRLARRLLQSVPIGIGAIAFAGFFFYLMPRTSPGSLRRPLPGQSAIGLPKSLSYGAVGRLKADDSPTMRVTLRNYTDDKEYVLSDPPYIRGHVMDTYFPPRRSRFDSEGQWVFSGIHEYRPLPKSDYARELQQYGRDMVRVEFDVRRKYLPTLVTMSSPFALQNKPRFKLGYEKFSSTVAGLSPDQAPSGTSVVYEMGSVEFAEGKQMPITPMLQGRTNRENYAAQTNLELLYATAGFEALDSHTKRVLSVSNGAPELQYQAARIVEQHFVNSGEFGYTLDLTLPDDPALDPIIDFVLNKRQGHCQYFAAAQVAIMRRLGIPSRIVAGYYPREYNRRGNYFAVKQSDAHAWVEGLFSREQLEGTDVERWLTDADKYYWVRFDPTPASSDDGSGIVDQDGQAFDYAEKLWKDYVVDGQKLTGKNSLYDPVAENSRSVVQDLIDRVSVLREGLTTQGLNTPVSLAVPLIIIVVMVGLTILVIWRLYYLLPRFAPRLAKRLGVGQPPSSFEQEFFAKCVTAIEKLGLVRKPNQTAAEFVDLAADAIDTRPAQESSKPELRTSLRQLAKHYYQQRFGKHQPSDEDQLEISDALDTVENGVNEASRH